MSSQLGIRRVAHCLRSDAERSYDSSCLGGIEYQDATAGDGIGLSNIILVEVDQPAMLKPAPPWLE